MSIRALIAAAATLTAFPASAQQCPYWNIGGDYVLRQSNGIDVNVHLEREGNKLTGQARFYSSQFEHDIAGPLEGFVDGDQLHFRVSWYLLNNTCLKYYGLIPITCWSDKYDENGIYEGAISANGELQGSNYPFERPNARTNWFLKSALECRKLAMIPHWIPKPAKPDAGDAKVVKVTNAPPIAEVKRDPIAEATNLSPIAIGPTQAGRLAGASAISSGIAEAGLMTGEFKSSFGKLTLASGSGNYEYNHGRVTVSRVDGNVMEGIWEEDPSSRKCADGRNFGRFRFTFTADGFTGSYGYCDQAPAASNVWNGTRG